MIRHDETPDEQINGVPVWRRIMRRARALGFTAAMVRLQRYGMPYPDRELEPCVVVRVGDIVVVEPVSDDYRGREAIDHLLHEVRPRERFPRLGF